jgi:hypothetical protein
LFQKHRELAAKLQEAVDKQDEDDNHQGRVSPMPDAALVLAQQNRGLTRAAFSMALLRLAGDPDVDDKRFALPSAEAKVPEADWTRLERNLRAAWSVDLVNQWQNTPSPLAADGINRLVSPWASKKQSGIDKDASQQLLHSQRTAFREWLQERYTAEGRFITSTGLDQSASAFFLEAARELRAQGSD